MSYKSTWSQGGAAYQAPQQVKLKAWATDGFISEFCDPIADDLNISYDAAATYNQWVSVINHLYFLSTGIKTKPKVKEEKKERRRGPTVGVMQPMLGGGVLGSTAKSKEEEEAAEKKRQKEEEEARRREEEEEERQAEAEREEPKLPPGPLRDKVGPVLKQYKKALQRAELFFKKFEGYQKWRMQYYVSKMVDDVSKALDAMKEPGQFTVFPILVPETHDTGVVMVIEHVNSKTVRCTVVNPNPLTNFHPKKTGEHNPSKLKQMVCMTFSDIPIKRIKSETWWSMIMLGARCLTKEEVFYTHFCSWLTGKNFTQQIQDHSDDAYYATPAKSIYTVLWKSLVHSLKYVLRAAGVEEKDVKLVRHHVKRFLLNEALADLESVRSIKFSTKQLVATAARNTAASLARNAAEMPTDEVAKAREMVESLSTRLQHIECDDDGTTLAPALLDVTNGWGRAQQPDSFPLMECFRRIESVDQFAGAAIEQTRLVPANFLRVPNKIETFEQALEAINECVTLVVRVNASMGMVKNIALLVQSLIAELALEVLPHPLGPKSRQGKKCIWSNTPLRYGQQLHLLKRLHELTEFYINAIFSLDGVLEQDATRITIVGLFASIADAVIRVHPSDKIGLFTQHYGGYKKKDKFGFTAGAYAQQTATSQVVYPETVVARAHIIDYFEEVHESIPAANVIWPWEVGVGKEDKGSNLLMRQIAHAEAFRTSGSPATLLSNTSEGFLSQLWRQYAETHYFRNIVFWFKHLMNNNFIHKSEWLYNVWPESLNFEYTGEGYRVYGFDGSQLQTEAKIRFKSQAIPGAFTHPYEVNSENDVLHIKNLPTFGDVLGQRDSELLISYLTVPYIRIPLVLRFFATEDRVSCLRSNSIQGILSAVLFECGRFLSYSLSGQCPEMVPSEKDELIASPYGALINELLMSTDGIVAPVIRLVELASELDAGTVYNETTTDVILYLVRTVARLSNYVSLAIDLCDGKQHGQVRDVTILPTTRDALVTARGDIDALINGRVFPMVETWINEAMSKAVEAKQTDDIDKATALASKLYAHIVLLLRNVREQEFTEGYVSKLLSAFTFLTTRYTWSTGALPEIELYSIMHRQRRAIVRYLTSASPASLGNVMDAVVRIVTSSGPRENARATQWGYVAGPDCVGRFARLDEELLKREGRERGAAELMESLKHCVGVTSLADGAITVAEGLQDVELNVQTLSLTFKAAHLRSLPSEVANDANVFSVFSPLVGGKIKMLATLQCAVVEDAINRIWVRLVGQEHDVQFWKTSDPRFPIPDDKMMRYFPDDLTETERWIYDVFEPIRKAYFERNFWDPPIFILLPEQKLTPDNAVACLQAVDSQSGRKLKEVFVFRDYRCVHTYDVVSHGRRYYRRLMYTSNNRFCQMQLHPSTDRRQRPWAGWARHAAGDPDPDSSSEHNTSAVIIRHASHPENVSGSNETWVPIYLLNGLVPTCLQETHRFWQDEDDNVRGYPLHDETQETEKPTHILWIHWRETQFDPLNTKNTCVRIFRYPRVSAAPKASEEAVARSQFVKVAAEGDDAEELKRNPSYDAAAAELDAGQYCESDDIIDDSKAATIEDRKLMLVNVLYAREGTPLHSLAIVLARIELLSHILVWTTKTDYDGTGPLKLDLIQLPRLKLTFAAKLSPDGSQYLLYSLDHAHLYVSNARPALVTRLIQGVPHSLLLQDANGAMSILVPSLNVARPPIAGAPFSTELVLNRQDANWYTRLDTRYYLYPVHVSLSFMFTPTLASALYLLLLRFYHRDYSDVFRLAGTIGTDMELTPEEHQIFAKLTYIVDSHPNAHACRSKIALLVTDSPVHVGWYPPREVAEMIHKLNEVNVSCRLTPNEERRLLYVCDMTMRKMDIIRAFVNNEDNKEAANMVLQKVTDKSKVIDATVQQRKMVRQFYNGLMTLLREKLDVRVSKEDLNRLLLVYTTFASKPMHEYWRCLVLNRRSIVDAEMANLDDASAKVTLKVPPLGKDLQWLFYRDFNPLSAKPPGSAGRPVNDEGRTMSVSKNYDYYYCGAGQVRKANTCRCKGCNDTCGPNTGCPCLACEKFNETEGKDIRELIPSLDASKSVKTMSFFDAYIWMNDVMTRWQAWKRHDTYPYMERTVPLSLRDSNNSFLRYYELLTSTTKVKISQNDSSKDLAELLFHFSRDARNEASGLGHMMHFVVATPQCWPKLAKFNRSSKQKIEQKTLALYGSVWTQASAFRDQPGPERFPEFKHSEAVERDIVLRKAKRQADVPLHMTTILPSPTNTDCTKRRLAAPAMAKLRLLGNEQEQIELSAETLAELSGEPLAPATAGTEYAKMMVREAQGLPLVSPDLPFDLKAHPDATKTVAREMLHRLDNDMRDFADQANKAPQAKFVGYSSTAEAEALWTGKPSQALGALRTRLTTLLEKLQGLRDRDSHFLGFAMPVITRTANHIELGQDLGSTLVFLRRFAGKEATLDIDYLIASICSSNGNDEWRQLNPYLEPGTVDAVMDLILVTVLRANRIGHANRACELAKDLLSVLDNADSFPEHIVTDAQRRSYIAANVASSVQKADALAAQLLTRRVYVDGDGNLDPRFLLFEFTWNLVLRDRQRELIHEMYDSITGNQSIVKQMIMGAGKTTVVGPLLGLMLADGSNLVIQVVPPALLDFTRAVLRTSFSSVLQKQIFTFSCDRAAEVDSEALSKFEHAKQSRGIVVTTPSSIKSVFLKYVEGLDRITDESRPGRSVEMEKEAKDILGVLNMWRKSVLIMDEVDMLLHPLKSELNFPIGQKHNIDFTPSRWKMPIHIIDAIFFYHSRRVTTSMKESPEAAAILQEFKAKVALGLKSNALQEMPHLTLLNIEFYEEHLKPILARWTLLFLKAQHLIGLSDDDTVRYMIRRPTDKDEPDFVARVKALEEDHIKMLNLAFEWLNCYMPHILQKIDRVSFGIMNADDIKRAREDHPNMPRSRFVTAIPFIGKDLPSQSSEFAHPDIVIGLTVMAYRYEGLRKADFTEILGMILASVEKEVGRFSQRRTNLMFVKWVQSAGGKLLQSYNYKKNREAADDEMGMQPSESIVFGEDGEATKKIEVLPLKLMRQANKEEVDKLFKLFKRTPEVIHWFLCEHVFPEHMRHQHAKLSASGQELGGSMIFDRRIGFSGTPSDLLPVELGHCEYERGTDGQLMYTLTNPDVMSLTFAENGWTVRTLLDTIANAQPPYNALIDTGALITGMSNLQVAEYLLKHGLPTMEGVVFLDELDRKMIYVRATGRVLKLAECGIPKNKRFAFYDQVHTTGMDIEHTPNAMAIQTLGKDMTFRDFSQGAYRMRGIGQGQFVRILIIPEVYDLILRTLRSVRSKDEDVSDARKRPVVDVLRDVTAWLLVNSIRSEHTQHNQLCLQNCANVWRKEAFAKLSGRIDEFKVEKAPSEDAVKGLEVYREPVTFSISDNVPQPRMFSESVRAYVEANSHLINSDVGKGVVEGIMEQTRKEDEIDNPVVDVQMVQEQEEEREKEEEQEKEQEIEIEKFVDLAYSRDEEVTQQWRLDTLADPTRAVQFFKLSDFHLYKRRPIDFPDSIYLSRNYFNIKWSGHRRMRNVIVTLEWIPDTQEVKLRELPSTDYGAIDKDDGCDRLKVTFDVARNHQGGLNESLLSDLMTTALHTDKKHMDVPDDLISAAASRVIGAKEKDFEQFYGEVCGNALRQEETGRFTVAVTLEEAETLRRVIHLRAAQKSVVEGRHTTIALNAVPSNNHVLDASSGFRPAPTPYQSWRNYQCLRFFDGDMHYSDSEFGLLLRSLHGNEAKSRQAFFSQVIACRRRARQRWERTPIALLFFMRNAFTLLHQRVVGLCIRRELDRIELNLGDAFIAFNNSHSGMLSPDEVWGGLRFCRLTDLNAEDILDFIDVADTTHEGNVLYQDFICALTGDRELADELDTEQPNESEAQGKKLPTIEPHGLEQLKQLKAERVAKQRAAEREANKELESENLRVMEEIENEQIAQDIADLQASGNPMLDDYSLTFSFFHPSVPNLVAPVGAGKVRRHIDQEQQCIRMESASCLRTNLRLLKRLREADKEATTLKSYVLSMEFRLPKATHGETKTPILQLLQRMGKQLVFCRWTLPMYRFNGYGSVGIPPFEVDLFGVQNPDGSKGAKKSTASSTTRGNVDVLHIFPEARPPRDPDDAIGEISQGDFVRADGQKTNNSIDGITYEWMHIVEPKTGWVIREKSGKSLWDQISTSIKFNPDQGIIVEHQAISATVNELIGKIEDREEEKLEDGVPKPPQPEEVEDEGANDGLTTDVVDLLEALRRAKRLKPGDKVQRNPDEWDHGNDDGGRGTTGKVLKVENERVQVQWPSGHKGHYAWGQGGKFELIKTGEAEEGEEGDERETLNDERWMAELRRGGAKCGNCSSSKLEPGNWYRCNHCESYSLCKKCFRQGEHAEHDFTDMGALNAQQSEEIGPGAYVKIKLSVTDPKYGWEGAKAGMTGIVLDIDRDENMVTVELENGLEWRADLSELEQIAAPKDDGVDESAVPQAAYQFLIGATAEAPDETPFIKALGQHAKASSMHKYKVGDRVKVKHGSYGYPGEIRALLPNKQYAVVGECGLGYQNSVQENNMQLFAFKVGDRVRIKRSMTSVNYGLVMPSEKMHRLIGKIVNFSANSGNRVQMRCDYEGFGRQTLYDSEADLVGNGRWLLERTDVEEDGDGAAAAAPTGPVAVPTSSNVLIERAFQDGVQNIEVFIRDEVYAVDLATGTVKRSNKVVGTIKRDPPEEFVMGEEKKLVDDTFPHLLSVHVRNGAITVLCDGKSLPVNYAGALQTIKDKAKKEEQMALAMYLNAMTPLNLMVSDVSADVARQSLMYLGPAFPARIVNWMRLDWTPDMTIEEVVAWHMAVDEHHKWQCRDCEKRNSRLVDTCVDCKAPRFEKKTVDDGTKGKFRSALPRSRESQGVRNKLQGKLRMQYQKQLDVLDEGNDAIAGGSLARRTGGVTAGPQLPGAAGV